MITSNIDITVGELVRAAPIRARVFEKLGIDYCCGGKKPLSVVCAAKGLDVTTVLTMLEALEGADHAGLSDADALSVGELCDHIVASHHGYLREELPRLDFMTRKVAAVHGEDEPRLIQIRAVFEKFAPDLLAHMAEEEEVIFPRIKEGNTKSESPDERAALVKLLAGLEEDHTHAGAALEQFRSLTEGYCPPDWACNTFRALYDGLARLERDMYQHVHKENNVLFPRALTSV